MLFRAIKAIHPPGDYSIAGVKDFPDQKNISTWAVEPTKYMNKIGVILGDAKGNFMPKATTPAQEATGYGMATREQAIALSVRTHDKAPEIKASSADNSNPVDNSSGKAADSDTISTDAGAKLPDGFPSDLISIYEGGKITSVEEKSFTGGHKGYLVTVDHTGQKDSVVNGFYYSVMADAKDLDAMIGMHSHYYGTKGGYWIEIDFYQELGDEYKGYATIGYYKK